LIEDWQRKAVLEWWERRCQLRRDIDKMQADYREMGTVTQFAKQLGLTYQSVYNVIRYRVKKVKPWIDTAHMRLFRDRA
jgi:hypothetical protein